MPKSGGAVLREPMFHSKPADKYQELCNFEAQVKNIFITN